ncbi:1-phosphofructokinase family hexose kinase [Cellulosimicrobium composti]|uniref:1-phosphofructokinase family hexose kinase n=1 Tax=Cellulosimicrobium composti TaxID=2672572 RepID=A0ABX0B8Z6_9MICO|nr:PfkB family carbohydrate kinase [Cellulosimicrobium composti]NDO88121.1 1-phosphofructokinase family hexose kinase [Cellulosimicrobium composti]SMF18153.1 tagatose 6-phosphate kinase [Cellulosimicrobium cellulans J1]
MTRVVALTPNPAWDVTYRVDRLLPGESLRVRSVVARAGGKGVNVARVVRALGSASVAVCPLGGPLAGPFADDLDADGQPAAVVPVAGAVRQSVAVVPAEAGAEDGGHPTVLNEPGPALDDAEWAALVAACVAQVGTAPAAVVATVSGSLPPGTTRERVVGLVGALRAAGARVHVDVSGPGLVWAAEAGADLVKPNRSELVEATGVDDPARAAGELLRRGARAVVVTDGERGLTAYEAGPDGPVMPAVVGRARLAAPVAGNPTGAGDAAMAALAVDPDQPWAHRLALAAATSAAAVLQPVAGAVDRADVDRLLTHVVTEPES